MRKLFVIITVLLFLSPWCCFASETEYFKDDQISFTFPDGWIIAHETPMPEELGERTGWNEEVWPDYIDWNRQVFVAVGKAGKSDILFTLTYHYNYYPTGTDDFDSSEGISLTDEVLLNFHEENKEQFFEEALYLQEAGTITIGEADLYQSGFGTFIKVPVTITGGNKASGDRQVYYTLIEDKIVVFKVEALESQLTKKQLSIVESMIQSFSDTGFYLEDFESFEHDNNEYDYDEDDDYVGPFLWPILIVLILGTRWLDDKLRDEKEEKSLWDTIITKLLGQEAKESNDLNEDTDGAAEDTYEADQKRCPEVQKEDKTPISYEERLERMVKSGLITKAEYRTRLKEKKRMQNHKKFKIFP